MAQIASGVPGVGDVGKQRIRGKRPWAEREISTGRILPVKGGRYPLHSRPVRTVLGKKFPKPEEFFRG